MFSKSYFALPSFRRIPPVNGAKVKASDWIGNDGCLVAKNVVNY